MSAPSTGSTPPDITLGQVRTTADAAAAETAPVKARALRSAGNTLEAYAAAVAAVGDPAAVGAELARQAADYQHPDTDAVEPIPEDHRLTCGHLAGVLHALARQLARAAAPQRPERGPVQPASDRHVDL